MQNLIELFKEKVQENNLHKAEDGLIEGIELVYQEGGYEGEGDHVWRVFKVTEGTEELGYISLDGFYSSYEGTEWDWNSLQQVYPREVTVVQYFTEK